MCLCVYFWAALERGVVGIDYSFLEIIKKLYAAFEVHSRSLNCVTLLKAVLFCFTHLP
jgi:hypothetical protein